MRNFGRCKHSLVQGTAAAQGQGYVDSKVRTKSTKLSPRIAAAPCTVLQLFHKGVLPILQFATAAETHKIVQATDRQTPTNDNFRIDVVPGS